MKKRLISMAATGIALCMLYANSAFAYDLYWNSFTHAKGNCFKHVKIVNGTQVPTISGQLVYIDPSCKFTGPDNIQHDFIKYIIQAMVNWNVTNTKVFFQRTADKNLADVIVSTQTSIDGTNTNGITQIRIPGTSNGWTTQKPTTNWDKGKVILSQKNLYNQSATKITSTCAHELGHYIGLWHTNASNSVMTQPSSSSTPSQDDINGVNYINY